MIRCVGIPVLNRGDLLQRCLDSFDIPFETIFIINNGKDVSVAEVLRNLKSGKSAARKMFRNVIVEEHLNNLGCGPSWNRIIRQVPGSWLMAGSDVQFKPGSLAKVVDVEKSNPTAHMVCADGYSIFAMTPLGRQKVGLFDETFWPAYFEDVDHWRRLVLSKAHAVGVPGFEYIHGEAPAWGSSTINSDPALKEFMKKRFQELQAYYEKKWGGPGGKETFNTPFNKPVSLDYWVK